MAPASPSPPPLEAVCLSEGAYRRRKGVSITLHCVLVAFLPGVLQGLYSISWGSSLLLFTLTAVKSTVGCN